MARIFIKQIMDKVLTAGMKDKRIEKEARNLSLIQMRDAKKELLDDFNKHDITEELDNGPTTDSSFLPDGNLFSFIGFEVGDKPTDNIRGVLEENIRLKWFPTSKRKTRNSVILTFTVEQATLQQIKEATPYPGGWKGGSWALDLEKKGIDGFAYYLFNIQKFANYEGSRSKAAIQVKNPVGAGGLGPQPYLRQLLKEFEFKLKS